MGGSKDMFTSPGRFTGGSKIDASGCYAYKEIYASNGGNGTCGGSVISWQWYLLGVAAFHGSGPCEMIGKWWQCKVKS